MKTKGKDCTVKRKEDKKGTLADLPVGGSALIGSISPESPAKPRLTDMGFCPGERIVCLMESPMKDPRAYLIRGTLIALRQSDAKEICISK